MRVLIISTWERRGGAAVAASRLCKALNQNGAVARMLVRDRQTACGEVNSLEKTLWQKVQFAWERFCIWTANGFRRENLFAVSLANTGNDVSHREDFREADLIHLHWVNQGMLSIRDIEKILASGKPVVWTMHDMWNATAICHHARHCDHYVTGSCRDCFFMKEPFLSRGLPARVFRRKKQLYARSGISFVACSRWLREKAEVSPLMNGQDLSDIPNPIDTGLFAPADKAAARKKLQLPADKKLLLFGSMKVTDKRKGIDYMIDACRVFAEEYTSEKDDLAVLMMGGNSDEVAGLLPFPVFSVGFLSREEDIAEVYNAADAYVTPSLEENLPNTIMEALSCGTPCIGFKVGGIPEMISHLNNGYVAAYQSAADLAAGIHWTLFEADYGELSRQAREKVLSDYSQRVVAQKYIRLYASKLAALRKEQK